MNNRNKSDEIEFLREALKNTKKSLDDEKLMNHTIKQKRVINFKNIKSILKYFKISFY